MSASVIDQNSLFRWITYNCGLNMLAAADLCMTQRSWVNTYNRGWHGSDNSAVINALDWLVRDKMLALSAEGIFELADEGKSFWSKFAKPEWRESYSWKCVDPSCADWDFRVEICAANVSRLVAIVFEDINDGTYGVMENVNVVIENGVTYSPLYWHTIAIGVSIAFNASVIPQSMEAMQKKDKLRLSSRKWYLSYEDAEAAWLEKPRKT